ncbi:MAG: hypothetical protein IIA67_10795 [Planctomycetes bacterium]|nr:hypothetical protein [Planctomycetota bacterium]
MNEPLVSLNFYQKQHVFAPGSVLSGEYQINAVEPEEIQAVELSVLWYTEGKGEEDLDVHYFDRRERDDDERLRVHVLRRFETVLPNSPLSYQGAIVKINWCVRVRLFFTGEREHVENFPFHLGETTAPMLPESGDSQQADSRNIE